MDMDRKQVIIVALLVIAILSSATSVLLNLSVINGISIKGVMSVTPTGEVSFNVLKTQENTGGNVNGLG
jgi:hypothetical protein